MKQYDNISDILIHLHYCFHSDLIRDDAYIIIDDLYVQAGKLGDYDEWYCNENGLKQIILNRPGGTLVFFPGDFAYGHYGEDAQDFAKKWRKFLLHKLQERGLNATVSNNDILVDNNKITGTVMLKDKMTLGLISINPDPEIIQAVCLKPNTHELSGLSKYGIDAIQVADWYKNFVRNY